MHDCLRVLRGSVGKDVREGSIDISMALGCSMNNFMYKHFTVTSLFLARLLHLRPPVMEHSFLHNSLFLRPFVVLIVPTRAAERIPLPNCQKCQGQNFVWQNWSKLRPFASNFSSSQSDFYCDRFNHCDHDWFELLLTVTS